MKKKQRAVDRVRVYEVDGKKLRVLAKQKGGDTIPADIIHEMMKSEKSNN